MSSLHDFSSWLSIKPFYQTVFMFLVMTFYQTFLPNSLHVSRHDFLSNLSIKQSSCFLSWLSIKSFYQTVFMFPVMTLYQIFLSNSLHVFRHDFLSNLSTKQPSCFPSWLSIKCKKIMQKSGEKSIFSSLDESSRVDPISSRVESRRVENMLNLTRIELKMWATQLQIKSNSKCQFKTRLDDQSKLSLYSNEHKWIHLFIKLRSKQLKQKLSSTFRQLILLFVSLTKLILRLVLNSHATAEFNYSSYTWWYLINFFKITHHFFW